mmetsp:Transcript_72140/g.145995  ORF Transcript_72140/g.145995 Transcript_72140/m.145995 type:complete len:235 (-) Transcript_72140:26-730(-)
MNRCSDQREVGVGVHSNCLACVLLADILHDLIWCERVPRLIIAHEPETGALIVLVICHVQVICACSQNCVLWLLCLHVRRILRGRGGSWECCLVIICLELQLSNVGDVLVILLLLVNVGNVLLRCTPSSCLVRVVVRRSPALVIASQCKFRVRVVIFELLGTLHAWHITCHQVLLVSWQVRAVLPRVPAFPCPGWACAHEIVARSHKLVWRQHTLLSESGLGQGGEHRLSRTLE